MPHRILMFVPATLLTAWLGAIDGSPAAAAGASRFVLVALLLLPVLASGSEILRGPPPI
jgi:hypothetical protein